MRMTRGTPGLAALLICAGLILVVPRPLQAQPASVPDRGVGIRSMGQPQTWKAHLGALGVWDRRDDGGGGGEFMLGLYRDLANPSYGALGLVGEGYVRAVGDQTDGGFRLMAWSKFFALQMGTDYAVHDNNFDFVLSLTPAIRRGGLFHRGDQLRIDWYPGRNHSWHFGIMVPFRQRYMGRTRPYTDDVKLPRASLHTESAYEPGFEMQRTIERLQHAADWINRFTTPFFDQDGKNDEKHMAAFVDKMNSFKEHIRQTDAFYPAGHSFEAEILRYHEDLQRAFALALAETPDAAATEQATVISAKAREVLLDAVILPYNRLLGQRKQHDSLEPYGAGAQRVFGTWVQTSGNVPAHGRPGVEWVFRNVLEAMEDNRQGSRRIWKDSRLVWLPLHYAVHPEEHDTQAELDALLERALQTDFSVGNRVHYVINDLFHVELGRMIHAAQDYHVLWIHDYRGRNANGDPDEVGYRMTVEGYLQALIDKVRDYDRTWKMPVYVIMLDQFFYEANDGRLWMSLLEDPLNHRVDLPAGYSAWEDTIHRKQAELRQAIEESQVLQRGIERYGRQWAENQVKVHVNITHPTDMTFRSRHLIGGLTFIPDILMRDHRKISFYDITELDPSLGEAIYTGMGVGEHYVGATWDDRALLVRGPSLVSLKTAAREMLLSQGLELQHLPQQLQPLPFPHDYAAQVEALEADGHSSRGLQVHNRPGYGDKRANIVKGTLYNLMPAGSHQYIPDSLWNSPLWGGLLIGAALRGCSVFPISPSLANAPSAGIPQMSRANEVFTRFIMIQNDMRDEITAAGGDLRVGVYNQKVGVGDVVGKGKLWRQNVQEHPWLKEVLPFDASVWAFLDSFHLHLQRSQVGEDFLNAVSEQHRPKLHLKTQLFLSREIVEDLIPLPEWTPVVRNYSSARLVQINSLTDSRAEQILQAAEDEVAALGRAWRRNTDATTQQRAAIFLTLGSHNQDFRGTIMDGETLYVVSGADGLVAYLDFVGMLLSTTWVDGIEELDAILPHHSGFWRWVGRHIRNAL